MSKNTVALILTAGKGTRMKSKLIKNLHLLAGKKIIEYPIEALKKAQIREIGLIVGNDAAKMRDALGEDYTYIYQHELLGTAHALMQATDFIKSYSSSTILVLLGDGPMIQAQTLERMVALHQQETASATLLTATLDNPFGLGRIIRDENGSYVRTAEQKDATVQEALIKEVWTGACCFDANDLLEGLANINNDNSQGEYYLPDIFKYLAATSRRVITTGVTDVSEMITVNDRMGLAKAEAFIQQQYLNDLMQNGVTIVNPLNTYIEPTVKIASDTIILPFTYLTGNSTIGADCVIGPYTNLDSSIVGNRVRVERSTVRATRIDDDALIGPFAYLRPETHVKHDSKVGQFCEIKKSTIGPHSKVPHLSYVGDAEIGQGVNLGAGTIVVNYDGYTKHKTIIEDDVFIGCNVNLVAPIRVEKGSVVAAGSTITKDVPSDALAVARARQENKAQWAARRRALKGDHK